MSALAVSGIQLVVNADDFGASRSINRGVCAAFELELISTASMQANGEAFEDACAEVHDRRLEGAIGLHLNLGEGEPLSDAMRACSRFVDNDGRYRSRVRLLTLDRAEQAAVACEVRVQVARCVAEGIPPRYLDSHHHMHTELGVARVVVGLLGELGITRMRIARNLGPRGAMPRSLYRRAYNAALRRRGIARTELFGGVADVVGAPASLLAGRTVECEVHPVQFEDGVLRDGYTEKAPSLRDQVRRLPSPPVRVA